MSLNRLILVVLTILLISLGQIIFKVASNSLVLPFSLGVNLKFIKILFLGFFVYAISTILWVVCLKNATLSQIYPFAALAFFFVPLLEWAILGNSLNANSIYGALIISLGVFIATR